MTTKLTLSVEKKVVEKAKVYAKDTGRSLSEIIESYLESLIKENPHDQNDISPKLRKLIGAVTLPKNFDEEKAKSAYLKNKNK